MTTTEQELRDMLKEGKTLYQISRQFNTKIPEIFKLGRSYGISFAYEHNNIPRPNKQDLESMYIEEGMTQYQIGKEFGVHQRAVSKWLRKYNIPTRGGRGTLNVPIPPKEVLERMYIKEGMSQRQIAKELDVSQAKVYRWMGEYNIPTRGPNGTLAVPMPPKDELLNYIAEGLDQHQIAEKYEVCDGTIFNWCEYYDITGMVNGFRCMTPEHQEWRYAVFERDHYTCQKCGATNTYIQAHHIVPFADHPEIGYELENGITLCEGCHYTVTGYEYDYIEQFAAITQPHLREHEVIESMPWEPVLLPLSDKLFPDYPQEA